MRISDWSSDVCSSDLGHFGGVARLDQRLEPGGDEVGEAAAQHRLLAEQIGFAFLAEVGFADPRPAAADAAGISERDIMRVAAGILIDCDQAQNGRASCRERVCQVVSISVVAEYLTQKK